MQNELHIAYIKLRHHAEGEANKQTQTRLISSVLHVIIALNLILMQSALYLFNTGGSSAR